MSGTEHWTPSVVNLPARARGSKDTLVFTLLGDGEVAKDSKGKYSVYAGCWCHSWNYNPEMRELTITLTKKKANKKVIVVVVKEPDNKLRNDKLTVNYDESE